MKNRENTKKNQPSPVAELLMNEMISQIEAFLNTDACEREEASADLFNITPYPANLEGCEGAENYKAFLLERNTRMRRDDPTKHGRLSCSIVCIDNVVPMPRFFVQAVIMPSDIAMVTVYEQDDKGTNYRKTLKWNSNRQ